MSLERGFCACGRRTVAGVDEVGRGSWAGPVVAAAVVLSSGAERLEGIRDSKTLTAPERERLFGHILASSRGVGIGWSSHHVIDRLGIAEANRAAMRRAVLNLPLAPDALLIDAVRLRDVPLPQVCLPKGESLSLSIAAASIVAKVVRDHWMVRCDLRYPVYGFARHKGYGTYAHRHALLLHGPCLLHRRSFRPISDLAA